MAFLMLKLKKSTGASRTLVVVTLALNADNFSRALTLGLGKTLLLNKLFEVDLPQVQTVVLSIR